MSPVQVGVAAREITPAPGLDIAGSLSPIISLGTRDPLFAKALVLDDGASRAVLVALDLLALERPEVLRARELIAMRSGVSPGNVMISCTHTHQGPTTIHYAACSWPTAYVEALPRRIADVVVAACANLEPVVWGFARTEERTVGHYRRVRLIDGRVRNTWQLPPDARIETPLGEIDPEVAILGFRSAAGPGAVILNYACHATCRGDGRWSANYPGALASSVGPALGLSPEAVLYTSGAAANTNPTIDDPTACGEALARAIAPAWSTIAWRGPGKLVVRERAVALPHRRVDRFPYEQVDAVWNNHDSPLGFALALKYYADEYLKLLRRGPVDEDTALQVLALDDVAFIAIPGELFVELGREIKRQSPFPRTVIVSLANDWIGYLPHRTAFEEGGYETIYASQSRLAPEAGEIVVHAATALLQEAARQ